jgi:hypothetical protein
MEPTHVDLIQAIGGAARVLGWAIGISSSAFLIILGWIITALFRSWSKRIDAADEKAAIAHSSSVDVSKMVTEFTGHCQEMRAECREGLMKELAERPKAKDVRGLDSEQRKLLEQSINALQALVMQQSETVEKAIIQMRDENAKFKDTFWDAFHKHAHSDDGSVIRR